MPLQNRSTPTSPAAQSSPSAHELKQRVITCLNKLADRDTLALAATELESIARNLNQDSFSPFLNCLHNTDSSSKSPVRKHCVALLSMLCLSHGNDLAPHLPKMVSVVLCRLHDSESAVRSACATAVASMSSCITRPAFSVLSKPLIDVLTHEQDGNVQIGAAMCLAAAVEAAPNPDVEQLKKALPKIGKLLKNEGFKAKSGLLGVIGSVVNAGGGRSKGVLDWLVSYVTEFLSSEDWAVRKAATEVLGKIALAEKELAPEYKKTCLAALESRRFDKVKIVRETMNRTLELWKQVPGDSEVSPPPSHSKSSSRDNNRPVGCFPPGARTSSDGGFNTPRSKKTVPTVSRSPASDGSCVTTANKDSPLRSTDRNSSTLMSSRLDHKKHLEWKMDFKEVQSPFKARTANEDLAVRESGEKANFKSESQSEHPIRIRGEKSHKLGSLKSGSRVAPCDEDDNACSIVGNAAEEVDDDMKDAEDMSLIREQLAHIENQQSNLLDLLQRFIGSSQIEINSLESRVLGLEMALDEISYDFALSNRRIPNSNYADNPCCKLPGADFLSSKFRRKTEARFPSSEFSSAFNLQPVNGVLDMPNNKSCSRPYSPDSLKFQQECREGFLEKPLAVDVYSDPRLNSRSKINFYNAENLQIRNAGKSNAPFSGTVTVSRLSA